MNNNNRNTYLSILIFSVILIASCKPKNKKTAIAFSDEVVKMEESLGNPIITTEREIKSFADSANYPAIAKAAEKMEKIVEQKVTQLKDTDASDYEGGEDFKTMAVRYFEYIKSLYATYRDLGNAKDEPARVEISKKMNDLLIAQASIMANMQHAQAKFAFDNGFQVQRKTP